MFGVSSHTIVHKASFLSCHVMSCLSRPPSRCGSDEAVLSPPHHSPVCCHLSHQGHPTASTFVQPGLLLLLSSPLCLVCCLCVMNYVVHLIVFLSHPFPPLPSSPQLPPLSLPAPFTPYMPTVQGNPPVQYPPTRVPIHRGHKGQSWIGPQCS